MGAIPAPFTDINAWLAEPKAPIPVQSARFLCDLLLLDPRDSLVLALAESLVRFAERMRDDEEAYRNFRSETAGFVLAHARWREEEAK